MSCLAYTDWYGKSHDEKNCDSGKHCCGVCEWKYCCTTHLAKLDDENCSYGPGLKQLLWLLLLLPVIAYLIYFFGKKRPIVHKKKSEGKVTLGKAGRIACNAEMEGLADCGIAKEDQYYVKI
ncbi:hypothetical protein SNEBB_010114 [Seison nebaliae]|nr:hypothetical protein SNEBB_010114 [Seison nebaliae]